MESDLVKYGDLSRRSPEELIVFDRVIEEVVLGDIGCLPLLGRSVA